MPPAMNSNGKHSDSLINAQFIAIHLTPGYGFLTKKAQCRHCKAPPKSWNISTILKPHLASYVGYKKYLEDNSKDLASMVKKQPTIPDFFSAKDSTTEDLFALIVFTSIASFSLFDTLE
jgi:hypothetical protein